MNVDHRQIDAFHCEFTRVCRKVSFDFGNDVNPLKISGFAGSESRGDLRPPRVRSYLECFL